MARRREIIPALFLCASPWLAPLACGDSDPDEAPNGGNGDGDGDGDGDGAQGGAGAGSSDACQSDKECSSQDALCDLNRGVCVDCFTSAECGESEECISGECVGFTPCASSKDCSDVEVCDTTLGRCVDCVGDNDCMESEVCVATQCTASCGSDKDCNPFNQVCNLDAGGCQDCVTAADCGSAMTCSDRGTCISDLSGGDGDGDGDSPATGGQPGDGDGDSGMCSGEVKILLQRSGAMFENPSEVDSWWDAVSEALDNEGADLLDTYASQLNLSVSTFHMTPDSCPIMNNSTSPLVADGLSAFLDGEKQNHTSAAVKIDAPLPEAIGQATSSMSSGDTLVLIISGNPDSCDRQDDWCSIIPSVEALQAAAASGITTKLLFIELPQAQAYDGYAQALANAGAGQPVAEMDGLGDACQTDPTYYSDVGGSTSFEAPNSTSEVAAALGRVLASVGSCE